jgi:hypothetical protein
VAQQAGIIPTSDGVKRGRGRMKWGERGGEERERVERENEVW